MRKFRFILSSDESMRSSIKERKKKHAENLKNIDAFLKNGGKIKKIPAGESGINKLSNDPHMLLRNHRK